MYVDIYAIKFARVKIRGHCTQNYVFSKLLNLNIKINFIRKTIIVYQSYFILKALLFQVEYRCNLVANLELVLDPDKISQDQKTQADP